MNMLKPLNARNGVEKSRVKRLRELTHEAHERLDKRITGAEPFADRELYGLFLNVQYQFHRDIEALYANATLQKLLPDLANRCRLNLIAADITDIDLPVPVSDGSPAFRGEPDIATALGWLYVAEGSNLGAAILLKRAAVMGLDENFGARHLAPHPQGRGLRWHIFTEAFDVVPLNAEEEGRVIAGGVEAFDRVHALVGENFE
ncbi:MAG: biliverdin-producing heme oxygenase [Hyphomicrobiales bacterium]|nr:MAG: biliverdin-producing heme oxygenase [Hyphomicrobiales bacterium]